MLVFPGPSSCQTSRGQHPVCPPRASGLRIWPETAAWTVRISRVMDAHLGACQPPYSREPLPSNQSLSACPCVCMSGHWWLCPSGEPGDRESEALVTAAPGAAAAPCGWSHVHQPAEGLAGRRWPRCRQPRCWAGPAQVATVDACHLPL